MLINFGRERRRHNSEGVGLDTDGRAVSGYLFGYLASLSRCLVVIFSPPFFPFFGGVFVAFLVWEGTDWWCTGLNSSCFG